MQWSISNNVVRKQINLILRSLDEKISENKFSIVFRFYKFIQDRTEDKRSVLFFKTRRITIIHSNTRSVWVYYFFANIAEKNMNNEIFI